MAEDTPFHQLQHAVPPKDESESGGIYTRTRQDMVFGHWTPAYRPIYDAEYHGNLLLRGGLKLPFEPVPLIGPWTCMHCGRTKVFETRIRGFVDDNEPSLGIHFYPHPVDKSVQNQRECRGMTMVQTLEFNYESWRGRKQRAPMTVGHNYTGGGYLFDPAEYESFQRWSEGRESLYNYKIAFFGRGICPNPGWHWKWPHEEEARQQAAFLAALPALVAYRLDVGRVDCGDPRYLLPFPAEWIGDELPMVLAMARIYRLESIVKKLVQNTHLAGEALRFD